MITRTAKNQAGHRRLHQQFAYMSGTNNIDNGVRIVDVTGDGLPDFLQCELSSGSVTDCKSPLVVSSCHCVANLSQCLSKLYTVLLRHIVNNQPNHCHSHLKYERPYH
jgi:hypothetical protein